MSTFRFTLESVMKLRNQTRDECRRQLGLAVGRLTQIESLDRQILDEQAELRSYLKELSQMGTVSVGLVSRCQMHLAQLERKHQQALAARAEAQSAVDVERAKLIAADQDVKVMEKLRDKQWENYCQEQNRRERIEQEEILAAYHHRKLSS
jgi:flagellar FliJ protein